VFGLVEPPVFTMHSDGTEAPVRARSVQFHVCPDGITLVTVGLVPTICLPAFRTVSAKTTFSGPVDEPVAVVVAPDALHKMLVGMTAPTRGVSVMT